MPRNGHEKEQKYKEHNCAEHVGPNHDFLSINSVGNGSTDGSEEEIRQCLDRTDPPNHGVVVVDFLDDEHGTEEVKGVANA